MIFSSLSAAHGWLLLDKPVGLSSNDALQKVRRCFGRPFPKAGHAGTLDPLASGVLPIALGEATKALSWLLAEDKAYDFTVRWGIETDSLDSEGAVTAKGGRVPERQEIEAVLPRFLGGISQMPPVYSALKIGGRRACDLAREGQEVELAARDVFIQSLTLTEHHDDGTSSFALSCGKGTYVRALARDIAVSLGTFATVTVLRRTRVGNLLQQHAVTLEQLAGSNVPLSFLLPLSSALDDILAVDITEEQKQHVRYGRVLAGVCTPCDDDRKAFARCDDTVIALGTVLATGDFVPSRVLNL